MEDKGKGLVGEDEENSLSVSEGGPSNMEVGDESDDAGRGIPTTFERLEYEALAEKKRKALFDSQRDGSEKRGKYDAKELVFTGRRRRRRMNKKRGRRQGSKKQISPEIQKRMTEAIFLHADNKDSESSGTTSGRGGRLFDSRGGGGVPRARKKVQAKAGAGPRWGAARSTPG
uniref:Uncharacterized protein n=1 Tax=Brassica oleracea var. oleracea TaxID=109376 RepID=A0A0D2ZTE4_BRAOL